MSVDQTCESIIRQVNLSRLDYQMNQTPYSMHFSIRKKFLKGHNQNLYISSEMTKDLEIFHLKQECKKLYDLYQIASETKANLSSDILVLKSEADALKHDLSVAKEDLNVKVVQNESLIKNKVDTKIECNGKCVQNATFKKEKKVKKRPPMDDPPSKKLKSVEAYLKHT